MTVALVGCASSSSSSCTIPKPAMGARTIGGPVKTDGSPAKYFVLGAVPASPLDDLAHEQWASSELIQQWKDAPQPKRGMNPSSECFVHLRKLILSGLTAYAQLPGNAAAGRIMDLFSAVTAQLDLAYGGLQNAALRGDQRALAFLHEPSLVVTACFVIVCKVEGRKPRGYAKSRTNEDSLPSSTRPPSPYDYFCEFHEALHEALEPLFGASLPWAREDIMEAEVLVLKYTNWDIAVGLDQVVIAIALRLSIFATTAEAKETVMLLFPAVREASKQAIIHGWSRGFMTGVGLWAVILRPSGSFAATLQVATRCTLEELEAAVQALDPALRD